MILGIPNVGKSTLINFLAGTAATRTANTPGHTRGKQWVRLSEGLDLLDTPGVLWPKFDDQVAALRLAATGAIAGDVFNADEVVRSCSLLWLKRHLGFCRKSTISKMSIRIRSCFWRRPEGEEAAFFPVGPSTMIAQKWWSSVISEAGS